MRISRLNSFPPNTNPYTHDLFNMGCSVGNNIEVMYAAATSERAKYLIVINKETGERIKLEFEPTKINVASKIQEALGGAPDQEEVIYATNVIIPESMKQYFRD